MWRAMFAAIKVVPVALVILAGSAFAQGYSSLAVGERQAMDESLQYALEYNRVDQPAEWVNPDSGRSGAAVPIRTFTNAWGQPCREFITTVIVGGREEQAFGTACRQADGDWKIVYGQPAEPSRVYVEPAPVRYVPVERYYYDPYGYYAPFNIFFSFSSVHRGGHHRVHFIDGHEFRHRHVDHHRRGGKWDGKWDGRGRGRGGRR